MVTGGAFLNEDLRWMMTEIGLDSHCGMPGCLESALLATGSAAKASQNEAG
jgi:hypothetical protein